MASDPTFRSVTFPALVDQEPSPDWPLGVTAQVIMLRHFRELLDLRQAAWLADDSEAVHQIRVAARRTRTALQTFSSLWHGKRFDKYLDELSEFADAFTAAREIDTMVVYLSGELAKTEGPRHAAFELLLSHNLALREKQQPLLHRELTRFERRGIPDKLVDYFSRNPLDLWTFGKPATSNAPLDPSAVEAGDG
jgi:CHAD domain-containing protein